MTAGLRLPLLLSSFTVAAWGCAAPPSVEHGAEVASGVAPPSTERAAETATAAAASAANAPGNEAPPETTFMSPEPVTLWIRGGDVITGDGKPRRRTDVVVRGDTIVHVGPVAPGLRAKETIDASGLVVTPGFIDTHAHADPFGGGEHLLAQGVTTIVLGQDGYSPAERIGTFLDKVDTSRPRVNVATLVGHHTVRTAAGAGASPKPSERALEKMTGLVEQGMKEGAFGLSTGLEYEPGALAQPEELARIAGPVGARGGVVMSHLRSEDDDKIDGALAELFQQCKEAKARAHVAHLKIVLGKGEERAQAVLRRLAEARTGGLEVTADLYPYTASYTTVGILFPAFAKAPNDYGAARAKQKDRLLEHLKERVTKRNGPGAMIFGTGTYAGQTLAEVAKREGRPFEQVLLELGPTGASAAYFVMDEAVMEAMFKDPFVMIGTDGGGGGLHPRGHGTFARVIAELVQKKRLVTLEEAVRKMAPLAARTVGFASDRGALEAGKRADLAIFDPTAIEDVASFSRPHLSSKGMKVVVVNGEVAWRNGKPTSARPGKAIRRRDAR